MKTTYTSKKQASSLAEHAYEPQMVRDYSASGLSRLVSMIVDLVSGHGHEHSAR